MNARRRLALARWKLAKPQTLALTKSEAFEVLEVVQGVGEDGSALIEVEQRLIDFVYQEATG